jgi:hypothetical protein
MAHARHAVIVSAPNARSAWERMRKSARAAAPIKLSLSGCSSIQTNAQTAIIPWNLWTKNAQIADSSYVQSARRQLPRMTPFAPNVMLNLNTYAPNVTGAYMLMPKLAPIVALNSSASQISKYLLEQTIL